MTQQFIAETDDDGKVVCVWINQPQAVGPKVFDPASDHFDRNAPADFSGAEPDAISAWIEAHRA